MKAVWVRLVSGWACETLSWLVHWDEKKHCSYGQWHSLGLEPDKPLTSILAQLTLLETGELSGFFSPTSTDSVSLLHVLPVLLLHVCPRLRRHGLMPHGQVLTQHSVASKSSGSLLMTSFTLQSPMLCHLTLTLLTAPGCARAEGKEAKPLSCQRPAPSGRGLRFKLHSGWAGHKPWCGPGPPGILRARFSYSRRRASCWGN